MLISDSNMVRISDHWSPDAHVVLHQGDCRDLLSSIPSQSVALVVTSPPYNVGKKYEKRIALQNYLGREREIIDLSIEKLTPGGSICWQVGNHVDSGEVYPLDILLYPFFKERGLKLRNRIIWSFEHGLHCSNRLSGRHETILWFTKDRIDGTYTFNLDPVRVPQKYPGKRHFKGPKVGQPSANPLGKNPGDVWMIPNVKHNHPEKTTHPCQFPIELVERLVLSLTNPGDLILDPYMGVGSALVAATMHDRKAAGAEVVSEYANIARDRIRKAAAGTLPIRPRNRPIYTPDARSKLVRRPWDTDSTSALQLF